MNKISMAIPLPSLLVAQALTITPDRNRRSTTTKELRLRAVTDRRTAGVAMDRGLVFRQTNTDFGNVYKLAERPEAIHLSLRRVL
jgi:hypothetical protein